ncbi:YihA family ribosome biogenesis GTP-binding protein [Bacillus sp. HMF5848]|uniref:ribosome biogenesis GTP-binding protein YihA/YsxC n=1 Tax=Bacillus sp. HMF5848 TaxID=2495421 RepID=UPI000F7A5A8D|nr:ribosome biogenesis GTP-binding protein YihA/YsxC [Bacillus sp. HMF5848]RSK28047.1 YihA family ribosome biogenesis GTP-binding protein [Bacillus sp. HMF5848]
MIIKTAEIVMSAVSPAQYPGDNLPEIVLSGRSNVGKSSLINTLLGRKSLARISSKPGKTQTLNFYLINESFYFVDVPGYGYAKVSKREREKFGEMIETYLTERDQLKVTCLLVDLRHEPTEDDCIMYNYLKHFGLPTIVVATKADKIPKGKWTQHEARVRKTLDMVKEDQVVLFSSETGKGKDELWGLLKKAIK